MRILIPTGGSEHSDLAVRLGGRLAAAAGADVTLLNVIAHSNDRGAGKAIIEGSLGWLPEQVAAGAQVLICAGDVVTQIVTEAERGKYDLIVVGERPRHSLLARLLSPTSERVIAQAHCPVLIAKGLSENFDKLLICDSGISNFPLMDRFSNSLPWLLTGGTEITVLHVMSQIGAAPGIRGWQLRADAEELIAAHTPEGELLAHDVAILERSPAHPQAKIRHGAVVEEIVAESRCADYDVVIIGAHRHAGWQRLLLDDLAHQIISQIERPLLVIQSEPTDS